MHQSVVGIVTMTFLMMVVIMTNSGMMGAEARYRPSSDGLNPNIPDLLNKLYNEMGQDRFRSSWKEFNSRNSDQQDDFLMSDLSDEELAQLGSDFERLGAILATDPMLVDLYADFESNLNTSAFLEMDERLNNNHTWWGRIKKFLYRKLEKLADEISRKSEHHLYHHQIDGAKPETMNNRRL